MALSPHMKDENRKKELARKERDPAAFADVHKAAETEKKGGKK